MKLDVLFHYEVDEQTGVITYIGKEEITVDTKKSTKSSTKVTKTDSNPDPIITLEPNKLVLTQGAVDLLEATTDCRIDIKYKKKDKKLVPVIGTSISFNTQGGNKLSKSNTVSYRGSANEKLSAYGDVFKLEPTEDKGIFYLIGNKNQEETSIPDEIVDIESELNIDDLDNIDLNNFDFNLN